MISYGNKATIKHNSKTSAVPSQETYFSTDEVGKKVADYGTDDFLVKPVKPDEFIATVLDRLVTKQSAKNFFCLQLPTRESN
jgi:PleD family two-component response regulator